MGRFKVEDTLTESPPRTLLYGVGGVGKSTFANGAPGMVFIAAEDGLRNIPAKAVKPYPSTWQDILDAVDELAESDWAGIALDSLDWAEPLCWEHVCREAKEKDIESFGYGKGYTAAYMQWRVLVNKLGRAHAAGKRITLIAHAVRKNFKNPLGDDYEQWTIKLHEKATGLFLEWVDVVGFAEQDTSTVETAKKSGRFKALTTGKRVLRVQPSPAYLAKTRFAMPRAVALDWKVYEHAVREGGPAAIERMRKDLKEALAELGDDLVAKAAKTFLAERGETVASLSEALETVNTYLAEQRKAS